MKRFFTILALIITAKSHSQNSDTIRLSNFKLCELTIDIIKQKDSSLKQAKVEEMNLCSDGFVQDSRFENRIGYESALYPGVVFQKYEVGNNTIAKIHLTKEFKGYLPNGDYIDLKYLKAKDILQKYDSLNSWTSRGCSDYWGIIDNKQIYYYVKINKDRKPQYPVDERYYSEQLIGGIDIIADCYTYNKGKTTEAKPLFILDEKEVTEETIKNLKPDDIELINVIKDQNAINKYGAKGKNGVITLSVGVPPTEILN